MTAKNVRVIELEKLVSFIHNDKVVNCDEVIINEDIIMFALHGVETHTIIKCEIPDIITYVSLKSLRDILNEEYHDFRRIEAYYAETR